MEHRKALSGWRSNVIVDTELGRYGDCVSIIYALSIGRALPQPFPAMAKQIAGRRAAPSLKSRIARNLVARRQALNWTQEQVATAAGINPETVSRYERGVSLPSIEALERLALALSTELSVLVATPTSTPPDDAQLVAAWLSGLNAEDRSFVTGLIDSAVQHLKRR